MSSVISNSTLPKRDYVRFHEIEHEDEFPYGYRWVTKEIDGQEELVQVALTLEDVLHPEEFDVFVTSVPHTDDMYYLFGAFKLQTSEAEKRIVLADHRMMLDIPGLGEKPYRPDVLIVDLDEKPDFENIATLYVDTCGGELKLAVEITSPSTRKTDVENAWKVGHYYKAKIEQYVIVDRFDPDNPDNVALIDYHRGADGYVRKPLNEQNRIWLDSVKLWLGFEDNRVVCYAEDGEIVSDFTDMGKARKAAETKAREESDARKAAETKAREESDARKAAETKAREESDARKAAETKAREESDARKAAEQRIKELEKRLKQLDGGSD